MSGYAPITLQIVDDIGRQLFSQSVPFTPNIDVTQVIESAFILAQTAATPDPFRYIVEYYGYSESPIFPGYLGYEIESIQVGSNPALPNNASFYWELSVNGVPSQVGADNAYPAPGSTVLWEYKAIQAPAALPPRRQVLQSRRSSRTSPAGPDLSEDAPA